MEKIKKTFKLSAALLLVILTFCCCGEESSEEETERLRSDIVGIWMDKDGPSVTENSPVGRALTFYEYTSDARTIFHFIYINEENVPAEVTTNGSSYHISGNTLVNDEDNTGAIISIDGNELTMSNNSGAKYYKKLSVEEATGYSLYYNDEELLAKQQEFKTSLLLKAEAENSDTVSDGETGSETVSDTGSETVAESEAVPESTAATAENP